MEKRKNIPGRRPARNDFGSLMMNFMRGAFNGRGMRGRGRGGDFRGRGRGGMGGRGGAGA